MSFRYPSFPTPLAGGVSQQPAELRLPTHVTDAYNALFDVAFGFGKRPGTVFDRKFSDTPAADVRLSLLNYGASEQYIAVCGRAGASRMLRAFRIDGGEASVTISGDATTYLQLNSANGDQLRFRQLGEFAWIANTTVATALIASDNYTVERNRKNTDAVYSYTTTDGTRVKSDQDDEKSKAGYWRYEPGTYKYAIINFPTVINPWSISNGYWDDTSGAFIGAPSGMRIAFRRVKFAGVVNAAWDNTAKTLTLGGAYATYFANARSGDMICLTVGTAGAALAGWQRIGTATANVLTLPDANAANGTASSDFTDSDYGETNNARIGTMVELNIDFSKITVKDMHDVALEIQKSLQAAGASNAACAWVPQSIGGAFQITGPYRGDNAVVYAPVAPSTSLPTGANGDLTAAGGPFASPGTAGIFGGSGGVAPDADDTATLDARWAKVAPPSQALAQPDPAKMPVRLSRSAADTFIVGRETWTQRGSGDSVSNPGPRLFSTGQKISDITLFRSRATLIGGPELAWSEINKSANFFAIDSTNIVDSDPIARTLPNNAAADFCVEHRTNLVVNTSAGQFEAGAPEAFTPRTATLSVSTSYAADAVRPAPASKTIFFVVRQGDWSQIHEYQYDALRLSADAVSTTDHVDRYIPAPLRTLVASPNNQITIALPRGSNGGSVMYVYRSHNKGGQTVQQAWSRWSYDAGYRIIDVLVVGNDLWMLVENTSTLTVGIGAAAPIAFPNHGLTTGDTIVLDNSTTTPSIDGARVVTVIDANNVTIPVATSVGGTARFCSGDYVLEKQPLSRPTTESGWAYPIHMDRRIKLTGTFAAGKTTWILPSAPAVVTGSAQLNGRGSTLNTVVLGPAFGVNSGNTVVLDEYNATNVKTTGNYSAGEVYLGRFFALAVTLTRPFFRDSDGRADMRSLMIFQGVAVSYVDSGGFTLRQVESGRPDYTVVQAASNTPSTGVLETFLMGHGNRVVHTIEDSSPRPLNIAGVQLELEHAPAVVTKNGGG